MSIGSALRNSRYPSLDSILFNGSPAAGLRKFFPRHTANMRRIDLRKVNVARPNTIRDINRQIILNYVRERGPISRAEIAQETELQRSTVSLIVDDLKSDGLIEELSGESKSEPLSCSAPTTNSPRPTARRTFSSPRSRTSFARR